MAEAVFNGRIAGRLDAQVNAIGKKSPTFSRHSYLDQEGKLQIGNPVSKFIRTILMSINTLIVSMGSVIGLVLGIAIGYIGHPFFWGSLFRLHDDRSLGAELGLWAETSIRRMAGLMPALRGAIKNQRPESRNKNSIVRYVHSSRYFEQ